MNRLSRIMFLLIGGFLTTMTACKDHAAKEDTADDTAVLQQAPYAPLTDSLAHAQKPDEAGLYFRRAELLSRNNLHELAVVDYQHAWDRKPDEETGLRLAAAYTILGQTGKAIGLLQDCIKKFPENANFPGLLGDSYQQAGKTKEALELYNQILARDSLDFEAWYEKALIQEKAGDTASAIYSLIKARSIQPTSTYTLELAHLYAEQGNSKALALCDEVQQRDSSKELLDPMFIKGIYYSNTTQYKKAIAQFDSCVARDWKFTDGWLEKGIAQFHLKNYDQALATFQMTIKVTETYPDAYYWSGRCYEAMGKTDDAILNYQRAFALDKTFTEAAEGIKRLKG